MKNKALIDNLIKLIEPIAEEKGCELYYIEMVKEAGENYLKVYIDKEEGISLNDCVVVNKEVSNMLDIEDPISESYYLEISSPGIDRRLYTEKHYDKYLGTEVVIKLNSLLEGSKKYEGILKSYSEASIEIDFEEKNISIPREKIASISLKGEF